MLVLIFRSCQICCLILIWSWMLFLFWFTCIVVTCTWDHCHCLYLDRYLNGLVAPLAFRGRRQAKAADSQLVRKSTRSDFPSHVSLLRPHWRHSLTHSRENWVSLNRLSLPFTRHPMCDWTRSLVSPFQNRSGWSTGQTAWHPQCSLRMSAGFSVPGTG